MALDDAQRTELRGQLKRVAIFLVASMLVLLVTGASSRLFAVVIVGVLLIVGVQLWASSRYGHSGPSVYARIIVAWHLSELVGALRDHPELSRQLGFDPPDVMALTHASQADLQTMGRLLRRAGHPRRREPAQLTMLLLSTASFITGLVGGAYLPQFDAQDFMVLCHASLAQELTPPAPAIFLALGILGMATGAKYLNFQQSAAVSRSMAANPLAELEGLRRPAYDLQRRALKTELKRTARLMSISGEEAAALQSIGSTELDDQESWYTKVRWSAETDIVIAQVQLVLGLYLGLALPALLGLAC